MTNKLNILFVSKKNDITESIYKAVKFNGRDAMSGYAETFEEITELLHQQLWDVLIIIIQECSTEIDEVTNKIAQSGIDIPWVIVCGNAKRDESIRAFGAGCRDIVNINELERLELVVFRIMAENERDNKNKALLGEHIAEKERLALTLRSIGEGIIIVDEDERIVMINDSAERITGWSLEHAAGRHLAEVFNVVDKNTGKSLEGLLELPKYKGEVVGLKRDTVLITRSGDMKFISASISPIIVSDKCIGVVFVFRDVSRIRKTENELEKSRDFYLSLFENFPAMIWRSGLDGKCDYFNKGWLDFTGRTLEEEMGDGWTLGIHPEDYDNYFNTYNKVFNLLEAFDIEYRLSRNDGEYRWIISMGRPFHDLDGGFSGYIGSCYDITERKTAEDGLRRYQLLSENANDIIMFSSIDGGIIEMNSAALMSYRYTREEMLNKSIFELITPDKRSPVRTQSCRVDGEGIYYEATAMRRDGTVFPVEVSLQSADIGKRKYLLSIQRDITERKQVQKELERAREHAEAANQAKREFLANMSHEIRTPLNGMLGMIDLTLMTDLTEEQQENLYTAKMCASSLLNLINDILDFSRIEAKKITIEKILFDLTELIEQTIKPHEIKAHRKGLEFRYRPDPEIPQIVNGDPNRLKQVLDNLLENAIKFTDSGEINLMSSLKASTDAYLELEFQVLDTGVGIDSKDIGRIFDTFSQADTSITRKYGGSGLGLAISKQLIEMMGGAIWAESEIGKGSVFCFSVRLEHEELMTGTKHNAEAISKANKPLQILLAEDDKINQIVIARMLREAGHYVMTVSNGIDALRIINERSIDIVLMDIQMPELNGIETAREIRRREEGTGNHMPIIALTAYALQGDREKYLSAGMDDYIAKPVQINSLLGKIEKTAERTEAVDWNEAFTAKRDNDNPGNSQQNDLINEHSMQVKNIIKQDLNVGMIISGIATNIEKLRDALKKEDLSLIEEYAHMVKRLSSTASAIALKTAIFKLELAARRENLTAITENFHHVIEEFERFKSHCADANFQY